MIKIVIVSSDSKYIQRSVSKCLQLPLWHPRVLDIAEKIALLTLSDPKINVDPIDATEEKARILNAFVAKFMKEISYALGGTREVRPSYLVAPYLSIPKRTFVMKASGDGGVSYFFDTDYIIDGAEIWKREREITEVHEEIKESKYPDMTDEVARQFEIVKTLARGAAGAIPPPCARMGLGVLNEVFPGEIDLDLNVLFAFYYNLVPSGMSTPLREQISKINTIFGAMKETYLGYPDDVSKRDRYVLMNQYERELELVLQVLLDEKLLFKGFPALLVSELLMILIKQEKAIVDPNVFNVYDSTVLKSLVIGIARATERADKLLDEYVDKAIQVRHGKVSEVEEEPFKSNGELIARRSFFRDNATQYFSGYYEETVEGVGPRTRCIEAKREYLDRLRAEILGYVDKNFDGFERAIEQLKNLLNNPLVVDI